MIKVISLDETCLNCSILMAVYKGELESTFIKINSQFPRFLIYLQNIANSLVGLSSKEREDVRSTRIFLGD